MAYTPIPSGGGGGGGGGGAPDNATYVTLSTDATLTSERVLTAGAGVTVTDGGANGPVTIAATGGAPTAATYVTLTTNGTLTNERVLTAGTNVTLTDAGAGSTLTIDVAGGGAPTAAQYVTLATDGTLTDERVLTAGTGITLTDAGAGSTLTIAAPATAAQYLTLATDTTLTNERVLTAGTGISFTDGGAGSTLTIDATGGGFTPGATKRIPFGDAGGTALTDSADLTYDDTTNDLALRASEAGGAVGFTVDNTAAAAANTYAFIEVKNLVGAHAANDPRYLLTAGAQQYCWGADASNSNIMRLQPGNVPSTSGIGFHMNTIGFCAVGDAISTVTGQYFQVNGNSASLNAAVKNTLTTGYAAWQAENTTGQVARLVQEGSAAASTIFGLTRASLGYVDFAGRGALVTIGAHSLYMITNSLERVQLDSAGNVTIGTAALATTATDGFLYITTCAGVPTGVPTAKTGRVALQYDSTNKKLYAYNGAWESVQFA